jgi:integrase
VVPHAITESGSPLMKFTTTWIEKLKPDSEDRVDYTETNRAGFMLRVFPSGEKSFVYRYTLAGARRIFTIGPFPHVSLADAHERYAAARKVVADGADPVALADEKKQEQFEASTVGALIDEWQTRYANKERKRPEQCKALLDADVPAWFRKLKARDTKRRQVIKLLDGIVDRGAPAVATDVGQLLAQIFKWGVNRDIVEASPLVGMDKAGGKETPRDRTLTDEEVKAVWHRLDKCAMAECIRVALRLILVTAVRRIEIATAKWSDMSDGIWTIPGEYSKNGKPHAVPLSPLATQLFDQLQVLADDSEFVLPSAHWKTKVMSSLTERAITRAVRENESVFGMPHWTPHDLRRTARTGMARLGVPETVAERVINHMPDGMVQYDLHTYLDEKRDALNKWAAHVESVVKA